jgi:hypothetical protein
LIELLQDTEDDVRDAARQSLVRLSKSKDFGPAANATPEEVQKAVRDWRGWLASGKTK